MSTKALIKSTQIDLEDDDEVGHALGMAIRDALRQHKRLGQSIAVWQDGKVVTLAPEDIPVDLTDDTN